LGLTVWINLISILLWIFLAKVSLVTLKETDSKLAFGAYMDLTYSTLVLSGLYWHLKRSEYEMKRIENIWNYI
jgi:hypothetical protein